MLSLITKVSMEEQLSLPILDNLYCQVPRCVGLHLEMFYQGHCRSNFCKLKGFRMMRNYML
jgi:hypothetical protein